MTPLTPCESFIARRRPSPIFSTSQTTPIPAGSQLTDHAVTVGDDLACRQLRRLPLAELAEGEGAVHLPGTVGDLPLQLGVETLHLGSPLDELRDAPFELGVQGVGLPEHGGVPARQNGGERQGEDADGDRGQAKTSGMVAKPGPASEIAQGDPLIDETREAAVERPAKASGVHARTGHWGEEQLA